MKAKEPETVRRRRHAGMLGDGRIEVAVRAATYAAIPGRQKRSAPYMLKAREDAVKAAVRALRRTR